MDVFSFRNPINERWGMMKMTAKDTFSSLCTKTSVQICAYRRNYKQTIDNKRYSVYYKTIER